MEKQNNYLFVKYALGQSKSSSFSSFLLLGKLSFNFLEQYPSGSPV